MATMLSPGVSITEIDASAIVPTVSNSVAVFGGSFTKGPTGVFTQIANSVELEGFYGKPTDSNYNDWYQCKNFLDYGNTLLVSRGLSATAKNAIAVFGASTATTVPAGADILASNINVIGNFVDFEIAEPSITFPATATNDTYDIALKIISRNPGVWGNSIRIAIALPADFTSGSNYAFDGIGLNEQFDYAPISGEVGILVQVDGEIVERYIASFDQTAKDFNGKSMYIETLINNQSSYIFIKDNTAVTSGLANDLKVKSFIFSNATSKDVVLSTGNDGATLTVGEIADSYDVWMNKEEIDIDIVIGNESNPIAAFNLADSRKDCIAFIGAAYGDTVGKKATDAMSAIVTWRKTGELNINSSYAVAGANYMNIYDKYANKNRWVNVAGSMAGLRAATSTNLASWWASAGLERGQIKNVVKLAFNPNLPQRDTLYKNGLNPIVSFPGQGTVIWGQKTLQDKASSFDRINVRGLFNTLERSLWKMAKYQVFEFNDSFTRNRIQAMINPFLSTVQAGRGIQDYLVVCDLTNNTPDIISRNNLVVDVYIRPTFVAEFIQLRFTNAGVNSFASIIGA
jgi:phage tail sheath protein FI